MTSIISSGGAIGRGVDSGWVAIEEIIEGLTNVELSSDWTVILEFGFDVADSQAVLHLVHSRAIKNGAGSSGRTVVSASRSIGGAATRTTKVWKAASGARSCASSKSLLRHIDRITWVTTIARAIGEDGARTTVQNCHGRCDSSGGDLVTSDHLAKGYDASTCKGVA